MLNITTAPDHYKVEYKVAEEFFDDQFDVLWKADEIAVEEDVNNILFECTEAERHGILESLKLFTHYELFAGQDYWTGRFKSMFPRTEFQATAALFGSVELGVHAPFYNKINEVLQVNTPEFYNSWKEDEVLTQRMEFLERSIVDKSCGGLLSVGTFSMVEGAVLYSNFAFLKSFNKAGKNKIPQVTKGISFSARDETLHSEFGAWAFRHLREETKRYFQMEVYEELEDKLYENAKALYRHEQYIIGQLFSKGAIDGITPMQLDSFVAHRLNTCLVNLGLSPIFEEPDDTIQGWFYEDVGGAVSTDNFVGTGRNYSRGWNEEKFSWSGR